MGNFVPLLGLQCRGELLVKTVVPSMGHRLKCQFSTLFLVFDVWMFVVL